MFLQDDVKYVRKLINTIAKSRDGYIPAYVVRSLVRREVDEEAKCDVIVLTNKETKASYTLPHDITLLESSEKELYGIMNVAYDPETDELDNDLLLNEIKLKSIRFPGRYDIRCYAYTREFAHVVLTLEAAHEYIATHALNEPTIEKVDLFDVSTEFHALLSCFLVGSMAKGEIVEDQDDSGALNCSHGDDDMPSFV